MTTEILTAKKIAQLKPGPARREIRDAQTRGLYLHVQTSGAKSWALVMSRPNGKMGKLHLGPVGSAAQETPKVGTPLTLADARRLAAELQGQRALGRDVMAERKAVKLKGGEADNRFAAVALQFVTEYARPNQRRWTETARVLGLDGDSSIRHGLAERWADREMGAITSDDIYRVTDEAKRRGIPGVPARTKGISNARGRAVARTLSKLFSWALQHRKITANPCVGVFVPPPPKARDRVLTSSEVVLFWNAAETLGQPFGPMLKLLLLTGARLREVSDMRWTELNGDVWTIPGSRTKNHKPLVVPLPPLACDILAAVQPIEGAGFVFTTTGRSAISGFSKTKGRLDEMMGDIPGWRLHDLRRTAATGMADLGISPHIVEAVINHISGAKAGVAGVYNRAEYGPEKKAALSRWAVHVEGLVSDKPSNITALRK